MAVEAILQLCRDGKHQLMCSAALRFENSRNPNPTRKELADDLLALASIDVPHAQTLEERAAVWQNANIGLLDALHLASAEAGGADRFATGDDPLVARAKRVAAQLRVLTVLELFEELLP